MSTRSLRGMFNEDMAKGGKRISFRNLRRFAPGGTFNRYLQSSTIHGLKYISSGEFLRERLLWMAVVVLGFSSAGYIIGKGVR